MRIETECKNAVRRRGKEEQATREHCSNIAQTRRGGMRKAKAHLELILARDIKRNRTL